MRNRKWIVAAGVLVVIVVGAGIFGATLRRTDRGRDADNPNGAAVREAEGEGEAGEEWEDGYFDPRKEAKFERVGGEADRAGPDTPAAEQVENRAFPRSYVNDKRTEDAKKVFTELLDKYPKHRHAASARSALGKLK